MVERDLELVEVEGGSLVWRVGDLVHIRLRSCRLHPAHLGSWVVVGRVLRLVLEAWRVCWVGEKVRIHHLSCHRRQVRLGSWKAGELAPERVVVQRRLGLYEVESWGVQHRRSNACAWQGGEVIRGQLEAWS